MDAYSRTLHGIQGIEQGRTNPKPMGAAMDGDLTGRIKVAIHDNAGFRRFLYDTRVTLTRVNKSELPYPRGT
jgi:hypothetical protein